MDSSWNRQRTRKTVRSPEDTPPSALDPMQAVPPANLEDPFASGKRQRVEANPGTRSAHVVSPLPPPPMSPMAAKIFTLLADVPRNVGGEVLNATLRILRSCWNYDGQHQAQDCLETVSSLHPMAIQLLTVCAGFALSACGRYLSPSPADQLSSIPAMGLSVTAISELLGFAAPNADPEVWTPISLTMTDAKGFSWDVDKNTVPLYINRASELGDVWVMSNCMLTDAGVPTIARSCGRKVFTGHLLYGRGVAVFVSPERFPSARKCCELRLDSSIVAVAVMLSPQGPLLIHVHVQGEVATEAAPGTFGFGGIAPSFSTVVRPGAESITNAEKLCEWVVGLWFASMPSVLTVSGSGRHHVVSVLGTIGWTVRDDTAAFSHYNGTSSNRMPAVWGTSFDVLTCTALCADLQTEPSGATPSTPSIMLAYEDVPQSPRSLAQRGSLLRHVFGTR